MKGLEGSNPVRSSSRSGVCVSLATAAENCRISTGLSTRRAPENGRIPTNRANSGNFSLLGEQAGSPSHAFADSWITQPVFCTTLRVGSRLYALGN